MLLSTEKNVDVASFPIPTEMQQFDVPYGYCIKHFPRAVELF